MNALFQRDEIVDANPEASIYSRHACVVKICIKETETEKKKENYHVNAINDFLSASTAGRRNVKVKISNVNA